MLKEVARLRRLRTVTSHPATIRAVTDHSAHMLNKLREEEEEEKKHYPEMQRQRDGRADCHTVMSTGSGDAEENARAPS